MSAPQTEMDSMTQPKKPADSDSLLVDIVQVLNDNEVNDDPTETRPTSALSVSSLSAVSSQC